MTNALAAVHPAEVSGPEPLGTEPVVRVAMTVCTRVSLALLQAGVAVVPVLTVQNIGARRVGPLAVRVSVTPQFAEPVDVQIGGLEVGETWTWTQPPLAMRAAWLDAQRERVAGAVVAMVTLQGADGPAATREEPIEVLPPSVWPGGAAPLGLLAAHVLPNDPAVAVLLNHAADLLAEWAGDPSLDGYQSKDPARVRRVAAAIFGAVQRLGVTYVVAPASFSEQGQQVRTPTRVLEERLGNCLDVAVLCAAALEQAGLRPLLFLVEGHAFVGVWLAEDALSSVYADDPRWFLALLDRGLATVFDAIVATARPAQEFARAEHVAREHLQNTANFRAGIDVAVARAWRILPVASPEAHEARLKALGTSRGVDEIDAPTVERAIALRQRLLEQQGAGAGSELEAAGRTRLAQWRARLLDLTLNNRLLNHRETKRYVPLLASAVLLDGTLLRRGALLLQALDPRGAGPRAAEVDTTKLGEESLTQGLALTSVTTTQLRASGVDLVRAARVATEEGGTAALYLALGFLVWFESDASQRELLAPLLLRPVKIEREGASGVLRLVAGEEEPFLNPSLIEKLRADFGLDLVGSGELPRNQTGGVDVPLTLQLLRERIAVQGRWLVRDQTGVGLFTFAKFVMYQDLAARIQAILGNPLARALIEGSPLPADSAPLVADYEVDAIVRAIDQVCPLDADASQLAAVATGTAGRSFVLQGPPGTGKSQTITNLIAQLLAQGKRVLFVSEKLAALEVVERRLHAVGLGPFCLQLHARDVSRKAVMQQLAAALDLGGQTTGTSWSAHATALQQRRDALNQVAHALGLDRPPGLSVYEAYGTLIRLRGTPTVAYWHRAGDPPVSEQQLAGWKDAVERYQGAARQVGQFSLHPLRTVHQLVWTTTLPQGVAEACRQLDAALDGLRVAWSGLARLHPTGLVSSAQTIDWLTTHAHGVVQAAPVPEGLLRAEPWEDLLARTTQLGSLCQQRQTVWSTLAADWSPSLLQQDHAADAVVLRKPVWWLFFVFTFFAWIRARNAVRQHLLVGRTANAGAAADAVASAAQIRVLDQQIAVLEPNCAPALGLLWQGPNTEPAALAAALRTAAQVRAARQIAWQQDPAQAPSLAALVDACASDPDRRAANAHALAALQRAWVQWDTSVRGVAQTIAWTPEHALASDDVLDGHTQTLGNLRGASAAVLRDWSFFAEASRLLQQAGLGALDAAWKAGKIETGQLVEAFMASFTTGWLQHVLAQTPVLEQFSRVEHERAVASFRQLDRASLSVAAQEVVARLAARVPSPDAPRGQGSELSILLRELQKQRNHMPLRRLMAQLPTLMPLLKPCVLASPLSVAQHMDPETAPFDVVVFDEASQIPSSDAIGAIARGRQVVVVGDTKQLPPTSFFQRTESEDTADEADYQELESILNECLAIGMPESYLRWHYRSRDESLIAFSNAHYYDHRLVTFPSVAANRDETGVRLVAVQGVYQRGAGRTNPVEAQAVVDEVIRRLTDPATQRESIGIITFSLPQQTLIEDRLDAARRDHPAIESYFSSERQEPVFVKNLENVQGDERDTILFSICYGADEHGRVALNFGALNRQGGERRLNVAVTRARSRLLVFSSLHPEQIDLRRTNAVGVAHLKAFLQFAKDGPKSLGLSTTLTGRTFDSPFERQVCLALRARGWEVELQVGCSGYRIDLAVLHPEHPGRFVLGIECDGATYHSSRNARERDRLRQQILEESLGWRLHRIWSTDWWVDPDGELARADQAIRDAIRDGVGGRATPAPAQVVEVPVVSAGKVESNSEAVRQEVLERFSNAPKFSDVPETLEGGRLYQVAEVPLQRGGGADSWRSASPALQTQVARAVLQAEAPITARQLARRVLAVWGVQRVTAGLQFEVLTAARRGSACEDTDGFLWLTSDGPSRWQGFRYQGAGERLRDLDEVAPIELAHAMVVLVRRAGGLGTEELFRETLRLFGYASLTAGLRGTLQAALERTAQLGWIVVDGESVVRVAG